MISLNYPLLLLKDGNGETPWDRMAIKMKSVAPLRIVEIGDKPYIKFAYPDQTAYFSTYFAGGVNNAAGLVATILGCLPGDDGDD